MAAGAKVLKEVVELTELKEQNKRHSVLLFEPII